MRGRRCPLRVLQSYRHSPRWSHACQSPWVVMLIRRPVRYFQVCEHIEVPRSFYISPILSLQEICTPLRNPSQNFELLCATLPKLYTTLTIDNESETLPCTLHLHSKALFATPVSKGLPSIAASVKSSFSLSLACQPFQADCSVVRSSSIIETPHET
jgi:hypothetical protein